MQSYLRVLFFFLLFVTHLSLGAQDSLRLSGTVVNGLSEPLADVTIFSQLSGRGQLSDSEGKFTFTVMPDDTLRFGYFGFAPLLIPADEWPSSNKIQLTRQQIGLPITVVIGERPYFNYFARDLPPASLQLSASFLRDNDGMNVTEAFDGLPGLQAQRGALNTNRLSIRGVGVRTPFASDQVRLYWNDIPLTNGAGESTLEDIDNHLLQQAFVRRGPAPASLGAALGGSIHLISTPEWRRNWGPTIQFSAGSFGRNRQSFNLHNQSEDGRWGQDISLVRTHSNGYRENNRYDRFSATVSGHLAHRNAGKQTNYLLQYRSLEAGIPSSLNADDFELRPEIAAPNWAGVGGGEDQWNALAGISHRYRIFRSTQGNVLTHQITLFGHLRHNDEVRPFNVLEEDQQVGGVRTALRWRYGQSNNIKLGLEWFSENYDQAIFETLDEGERGELLAEQAENRRYLFSFLEYKQFIIPNRLSAQFDLNFRSGRYQWTLDDEEERNEFPSIWLPGLTLDYRLSNLWSAHARLNRGVSVPGPDQTLVLNDERSALQTSHGWNKEIGIKGNPNRWQTEVVLYQMDIKDALVVRQTPDGQTYFANGGSTLHRGIEALLAVRLPLRELELTPAVQYTLGDYQFDEFVSNDIDFSGKQLPGAPRHRLLTRVDLRKFNRWSMRLILDVTDRQALDDANSGFADGYSLLHWRGHYDFPLNWGKLRLFGGVNNIFDARYASMLQINARGFGGALPRYYYPGLPRYVYFGVRIQWLN